MKLDKKVVSLELSRKLWEVGLTTIDTECEYWWVDGYENYRLTQEAYSGWIVIQPYDEMLRIKEGKRYPAPLLTEMLEMLPGIIRVEKQYRSLNMLKKKTVENRREVDIYGFYYFDPVEGDGSKDQSPEFPHYDVNPANSVSELALYLHKENLL